MSDDDVLREAESHEGYEWREEPDVTSISEDELRVRLRELSEEEREISYRRRVIQGRIDLIRTEFVLRGGVALSPEELAHILVGGEGRAEARRGVQGEDQGLSPPERGEGR
jgi:RsiG-like